MNWASLPFDTWEARLHSIHATFYHVTLRCRDSTKLQVNKVSLGYSDNMWKEESRKKLDSWVASEPKINVLIGHLKLPSCSGLFGRHWISWHMQIKAPKPRNSKKKKKQSWVTCNLSPVTWHLSPVTCHLSVVICHLQPVTWHLSPVTCHLSPVKCHL